MTFLSGIGALVVAGILFAVTYRLQRSQTAPAWARGQAAAMIASFVLTALFAFGGVFVGIGLSQPLLLSHVQEWALVVVLSLPLLVVGVRLVRRGVAMQPDQAPMQALS